MGPLWLRKSRNGTTAVFVHGILSSKDTAWLSATGISWPMLLSEEDAIDDVGIYLFEYRTDAFAGTYSLDDAVDSMREHFRLDGIWSKSDKNVIFVCHSQGGIVVRRFLVAHQADLIEKKVRVGLFLVASPSLGALYANFVSQIAPLYNVQLNTLKFSQQNIWLNGLDRDFINLKESHRLEIFGKELIEDESIFLKRILRGDQIVPPWSGAKYFGEPLKVPHSNHITISKPASSSAIQNRLLVDFIKSAVDKARHEDQKTSPTVVDRVDQAANSRVQSTSAPLIANGYANDARSDRPKSKNPLLVGSPVSAADLTHSHEGILSVPEQQKETAPTIETDVATPTRLMRFLFAPTLTKVILTGAALFTTASLVIGWARDFSALTTIGVAVLVILFGLVISVLSGALVRLTRPSRALFSWALAVFCIALFGFLVSSAFFGVPQAGTYIVSLLLSSYEPLTHLPPNQPAILIDSGQTEKLDSLPAEHQRLLTKEEGRDRIRDIAALPTLTIRGRLQLRHSNVPRTLVVSTLRLDGGTIITNGDDLTIETNHLSSQDGWIRSFADQDISGPGLNGGRVTLIVHGTMSGHLSVDLRGQKGADGDRGRDGVRGAAGASGSPSGNNCIRPAGSGGKGLKGTAGTRGQDGFPGGAGGVLLVQAPDLFAAWRVIGQPVLLGGTGGEGGAGGQGGPGGPGGSGGDSIGLCPVGGGFGPPGDPGPDGLPGKTGKDGPAGSFEYKPLPPAK